MPVVDFREVFDSFRRILIVDDETNVRLILRMTLETESAGAQCELCGRLQNMRRLLDVETFGSCSAPIDLGCD
jgi:DNA-binding NtrC family response regulator